MQANKQGASGIIADPQKSQHEKVLGLFTHINDENEVVARCFDDWRRSYIVMKLLWLRREALLTEGHISKLTEERRRRISLV